MALATITRPCYVTREEVKRALDIKASAYSDQQLDRKCIDASDTLDSLCQRHFYPLIATYKFDWPNYQYTYPWKLYLDQYELAGQPTLVESGSLSTSPVVIPSSAYLLQPYNDGPPYTWLELRRDQSSSFGNNPTPQQDIAITGPFGYWQNSVPAGQIAAAISSASQTTVQMNAGPLAGPGAGNVLSVDNENMLVTDVNFVSTGINTVSGATTQQQSDNVIAVADGTQFSKFEIILLDMEYMLIVNIIGNNLLVKRAWDGSILATHSTGVTIWANRLLTVARGALGTTAATHLINAAASIIDTPAMVRNVAIATALIGMVNEPAAYSVQTTASWYGGNPRTNSSNKEAAPGVGYQGLIALLDQSIYVRKIRQRVILWNFILV